MAGLHDNVLQLTHEHVVQFMSDRFKKHDKFKSFHGQWDEFIQRLYEKAANNRDSVEQILKWLYCEGSV